MIRRWGAEMVLAGWARRDGVVVDATPEQACLAAETKRWGRTHSKADPAITGVLCLILPKLLRTEQLEQLCHGLGSGYARMWSCRQMLGPAVWWSGPRREPQAVLKG